VTRRLDDVSRRPTARDRDLASLFAARLSTVTAAQPMTAAEVIAALAENIVAVIQAQCPVAQWPEAAEAVSIKLRKRLEMH